MEILKTKYMMKRLFLLLLLIPAILVAQEEERYLPGAVVMENGKVVFTKEIKNSPLTQDQLFEKILAWAEGRFQDDNNRVAYSDKDKGDIAVRGTEKIVFSSTALSLDTSEMSYHLIIECEGNNCVIRFTNITYKYNVSYERNPLRLAAEEVIIDKYALNRNKSLNRINGKFRKGTIDFVDKLFAEIDALFNLSESVQRATPAIVPADPAPQQTITAEKPVVTPKEASAPVENKEGYMAFEAEKIPQALLMMLPESPMKITAGKESSPAESNGDWKGISDMFGKKVATVSMSETSPVYKQINGLFTISFTKEGTGEPWMIIECNKQGETTDGTEKTILGEIIQIWIK